ncbi:hypothetical protein A2Z10_00275 [Candidatus Azambacteria bacterium RBG_16_47_10]|uniref:His-Xaa-Ser system protein HxsD n=1 Tax=Candidatus Azambacteria bacterium RBG_16_47_10 TaxID=1797292 RepID=A0A1F5B186_9BACT|nr:MAG: hypothetical protein A2Z10_00275 [Candidatus Azambacteria bacterium RBG_16_47_10]
MAIKKNRSVSFSLSTKVYSFESIVNTAYSFLDRAHVFLDGDPKTQVKLLLKIKESCSLSPEKIKGEFHNELLEQDLRLRLARDNRKLREYIVGQALFGASPEGVQSAEATEDDELDKILERELKALEDEEKKATKGTKDPLGVLTTWNEKKGKKQTKNNGKRK